ncbi:Hypothetical protein D9617_28g065600 [Elsinoe fawcettii]|nr:Hypothetical protein D9617_28g065600 [Elsinoe fawcettii]
MARLLLPALLASSVLATPITPAPSLPTPRLIKRTDDKMDLDGVVSIAQSLLQAAKIPIPKDQLSGIVKGFTDYNSASVVSIISSVVANPTGALNVGGVDIAALTRLVATATPSPSANGIMASNPNLYTPDGPKGPENDRPGFGPENADSNGVYLEGGDCDDADEAAQGSNGATSIVTTTTDSGPGASPSPDTKSPTDGNGDGVAAGGETVNQGPSVSFGNSAGSTTPDNSNGQPINQGPSVSFGNPANSPSTPGESSPINTTTPDGAPGGLRGGPGEEACVPSTITVTATGDIPASFTGTNTPPTGDASDASDASNSSDRPDNTDGLAPGTTPELSPPPPPPAPGSNAVTTDPLDGLGSGGDDGNYAVPGRITPGVNGSDTVITGPKTKNPDGTWSDAGGIVVGPDGSATLTPPSTSETNGTSQGAGSAGGAEAGEDADDADDAGGSSAPVDGTSVTGPSVNFTSPGTSGQALGGTAGTTTSGFGQAVPTGTAGVGAVGLGNTSGPLSGNGTGLVTSVRPVVAPTGTGPTSSAGTVFPSVSEGGRREVEWAGILLVGVAGWMVML